MSQSAILYHNPSDTVFLIDIPLSISLAQEIQPRQQYSPPDVKKRSESKKRHIFSSSPLTEPYVCSAEPKTDVARAKVLERISGPERVFHAEVIEPLVRTGLEEIRQGVQGRFDWCLARKVVKDSPLGATHLGKRRRGQSSSMMMACSPDDCHFAERIPTPDQDVRENSDGGSHPPLILSSSGMNMFASIDELRWVVVRNTSPEMVGLRICCAEGTENVSDTIEAESQHHHMFTVPPLSNFLFCKLPIAQSPQDPPSDPIPGLSRDRKFDLILLDPPWNNRSVRRSGHYRTQSYFEGSSLTRHLQDIISIHLQNHHTVNPKTDRTARSIVAIWTTNSSKSRKTAYDALEGAGLSFYEEWVWIKTTTSGEPITPVDGLWRKPYEILIIGERINPSDGNRCSPVRRTIAAVPDVHSRKPNLREIFERVFYGGSSGIPYTALEVFARNLTAGWWACGDEVLKFNAREWWVDESVA